MAKAGFDNVDFEEEDLGIIMAIDLPLENFPPNRLDN